MVLIIPENQPQKAHFLDSHCLTLGKKKDGLLNISYHFKDIIIIIIIKRKDTCYQCKWNYTAQARGPLDMSPNLITKSNSIAVFTNNIQYLSSLLMINLLNWTKWLTPATSTLELRGGGISLILLTFHNVCIEATVTASYERGTR